MWLTCIRHGETRMNRERRFNGLTDEGITDAQRETLRQVEFDAADFNCIYASPLKRCRETAEALGVVPDRFDDRLRERNLGVFQGLTAAECAERFEQAFARFRMMDGDFEIPEGESRAAHLARTLAWLEEASAHAKVLAITHGGTVDFLYRLGSGLPPHGGETVHAGDNAAVTTFEVHWPDIRLIEFSRPLGVRR